MADKISRRDLIEKVGPRPKGYRSILLRREVYRDGLTAAALSISSIRNKDMTEERKNSSERNYISVENRGRNV